MYNWKQNKNKYLKNKNQPQQTKQIWPYHPPLFIILIHIYFIFGFTLAEAGFCGSFWRQMSKGQAFL